MVNRKPNLIYVFADQLRHDALGHCGNSSAITPNIDRLAGQSIRFTNTVSVSPVCTPHRAALFTGKYTSSTGMVINEICINPNHRAIGYPLHEAGYRMGYLGKWHLVDEHGRSIPQGPARLGFQHADLWRAYNFEHHNYQGYYWEDQGEDMARVEIEGYQTDTWNRMACDFIEEAGKKEEPFALFLSYSPPHDPWSQDNLPPGYYEKFSDVNFPHPPNFREPPDPYADRESEPARWEEKWKQELPEMRRCYAAMVNHLDDKIGELMEKVEQTGIAEDTIFVFTSDHGEMFGSQGRVYKTTFYDEAARVPFMIRWPEKIAAGSTHDACLNTPDIAPTLLGLLGLPVPEEMEGMNLAHCALGLPGAEPDFSFMQGMGHTFRWINGFEWRAIRNKQYTYARYLCDGSELLFDNLNDPGQTRNLAGDPDAQELLRELRLAMNRKMALLQDEFLPLTDYQSWMSENDAYSVVRAAKGPFTGPWEPIPSLRALRESSNFL